MIFSFFFFVLPRKSRSSAFAHEKFWIGKCFIKYSLCMPLTRSTSTPKSISSVWWNIPLWGVLNFYSFSEISRRLNLLYKAEMNIFSIFFRVFLAFAILFMTHLAFGCILKCTKGLWEGKFMIPRSSIHENRNFNFSQQFIAASVRAGTDF